jgi:alpha-L-rhamnosidase
MRDAQNKDNGYVPNSAPWQPGCGGGVAWGAAMNIIPWEYYLHYGDKKILSDNIEAMKRQVDYMLSWQTPERTMLSKKCNVNSDTPNYWFNLGDWAPAYGLPSDELVHTFYLWRCADYTAKAAKALGDEAGNKKYSEIARNVNDAFHKKFYNANERTYGDFGSNIFALVMGVPQGRYANVVETLRKEISEKYKGHLNTGIFGTQFIFETLAANGMNDLAYEVMNKRDFPSFGNWIEQGATVTWEHWSGKDSRNHPMFGGGLTWFYRTIAGINADENEPGYRHVVISPKLPQQLDHVRYSTLTPYGRLTSEVSKNGKTQTVNISVPVGCRATVHLPASNAAAIKENGRDIISGLDDVKLLPSNSDEVVVDINQGNYTFSIEN